MTELEMLRNVLEHNEQIIAFYEEHGWTQHMFASNTGSFCLIGASHRASVGMDERYHYLRPYTTEETNIHFQWRDAFTDTAGDRPMSWNDRKGRTKDEVMSMLRATSERVRSEISRLERTEES